MTDYDAFAAEVDDDELAGAFASDAPLADADDPASEPGVLGEPPALDDATWDAMLDATFSAGPAGDGLLAEFAASAAAAIEGIVHGLEDLLDGFDADAEAEAVEGGGIPEEQPDPSADEPSAEAFEDGAWASSDDSSPGEGTFGDDGLGDDTSMDDVPMDDGLA